ncbi:MAG: hypothetical protein IJF59_00705, partial [Clostridia bacterium]|nr:hypothetical protein [Clostridia bacterium]
EQPQPEAPSAERVAQLFTGQKVDYRTLAEGDMLYAGAVASLVTVDFPDFTDINTVPADRILAYGVWESLKNPAFAGGAVASEERIYVDAASVEAVARQELGFHGRLEHQTVGDFRFDVITSRYSAASHGVNVMGYAEVVSCEIEGDEATLTVRCYEEDSQNELIEETGTRRILIDISGEIARIRSLTTLQPPASH